MQPALHPFRQTKEQLQQDLRQYLSPDADLDPHHYTVLKGILTLYHQHEVDLSMALENGLILMSRPIDQGQSLYINSNHFD